MGIVGDAETSANWMAGALQSSGYAADFSPGSIWELERFFDEQAPNGKARPGGLLAEGLGQRLFGLGSYLGEVILRSLGGEWAGDDDDPSAEINLALVLPDGTEIWPVQRVMRRFKEGPEDSVAAYAAVLGLDVGPQPNRALAKRRRFRR